MPTLFPRITLNPRLCMIIHLGILLSLASFLTIYADKAPVLSTLFKVPASYCIHTPSTLYELERLVKNAYAQGHKISIVGSGKSQGGQTTSSHSSFLRISLAKLNKVLELDKNQKTVTVQAGILWKDLIEYLAPNSLALRGMQSYSDFSVGGSVSVNAHGRDFHAAPLIKTIVSFKLLQYDGTIITVSRQENKELFGLAIGGYGLFGIITQVTLSLTSDCLLTRKTASLASKDLGDYFQRYLKNNPAVELYSARFSVGKNDLLEKVLLIWYEKASIQTPRNLTLKRRSTVRNFFARQAFKTMRFFPKLKNHRYDLETYMFSGQEIISRNTFMNEPLSGLPDNTKRNRYILQEYFIPYEHLTEFISSLRQALLRYDINILNITARHINQDHESMLSFAPQECCSLVLYCALKNKESSYERLSTCTRKLIDRALSLKGTYYLPYQLLGTYEQLEKAYPAFKTFSTLKKKYDPQELFSNTLYERYVTK